ncbi:tRNA (guanine(10)-N(2))-dimethyltransferase [Candidatus Woesearchaeota archaeon]|nr:tRNA (guanine(10)-N(2))-dimethyltransferase [Candidatus Woesearchaeota archaeon]
MIQESSARIQASTGRISRKLEVFYNPVMSHNRDLTVAVVNAWKRKNIRAADPLAASGVRAIRLLKECRNVSFVAANDSNRSAVAQMRRNFSLNKISKSKHSVSGQDASQFLLESFGFDFIDIDPFGSPNPFLDAAVKRLSRGGILAVTATDTAALAGTSPHACERKYWAVPLKSASLHEIGLRILIRKIQLIAAQYEKALVPVFSYASLHYMRVFLENKKSKSAVDEVIEQHHLLGYCDDCTDLKVLDRHECGCGEQFRVAGPVWTGQLWDTSLVKRMRSSCAECSGLLCTLAQESSVHAIGVVDVNEVASRLRMSPPKRELIFAGLKRKGFSVAPTHLNRNAMRTDAPISVARQVLQTLSRTC